MIKPTDVTPEVSEALAHLRTYAAKYPTMGLSAALNVLDNKGVFAEIDEANDYASAEEILAESALQATAADVFEFNRPPLDREEWGDTTRADIAARQGLAPTGSGHDRSVCEADPLAGPSLHSGTCPVWAQHHNLTDGIHIGSKTLDH